MKAKASFGSIVNLTVKVGIDVSMIFGAGEALRLYGTMFNQL